MNKEQIFIQDNIVHVIQLKPSQNSKLGYGLHLLTYHFSIEQVKNNNLKLDLLNCLGCVYSYSNKDRTQPCYTHKGLQRLGLGKMLNRLNRLFNANQLFDFNQTLFNAFILDVQRYPVDLVRFGVYGEPTLLTINQIESIKGNNKHTGYTHNWQNCNESYSRFFMASVHNSIDAINSTVKGYRYYKSIPKTEGKQNEVNCPASKESNKQTTCQSCKLCDGFNTKKNIYIFNH